MRTFKLHTVDTAPEGYTKKQILELILMISQKTISNYVHHIAGTPLDEVSKEFDWKLNESKS